MAAFAALPQPLALRNAAKPFEPTARARNIISFGLWGDEAKYCARAIKNVEIAQFIYPEWTCRFYCDDTVPRETIDELTRLGAQTRAVRGGVQSHDRLFWRFFVSDDSGVDRFLVRDCDSVVNCQERVAVDAWIASGKPFHIMRDHINHMELILAGLWGGTAGMLPPIGRLLETQYLSSASRFADQDYLRERVWPLIKHHALAHDSYYHPEFGEDFPPYGRLVRPAHVGGG